MIKFPKRRKAKDNPYFIGYNSESNHYTITFKDIRRNVNVVEVNSDIFQLFNEFELNDLSEMNEYDNHIEHSEIYDETLYKRSINKAISVEDIVERNLMIEQLNYFIKDLPFIQRNRLLKYFIENKTYEEIAKEEGCTKRAIKFSVDIAIRKLSEKMKK